MKCRYRAPMTKQEKDYWFRFIRYTRGCIAAAAVKVLYNEFRFGEKTRIPKFLSGLRERIDELDAKYGWKDQEAERNELILRMQKKNITYGKRFLHGRREYAGYVHDVMYMAAMITLQEDFGFGIRRSSDSPEERDGESRLSRYFDALQREVSYVNHINDGWDADDDRVIQFDHYLYESLLSCRLSGDFIRREIFTWEPKEKQETV